MKAFVILCEGPHDVAFLYRVLRTMDFQEYRKRIGEYPVPLNAMILRDIQQHDFNNYKLQQYKPFLPTVILEKDDTLLLLYSVEGNTNHNKTRELINKYIKSLNPLLKRQDSIDKIGIIFFYDADDNGVDAVLDMIKREYSSLIPSINTLSVGKSIKETSDLLVGCYIFEDGTGKGKLENILLPLMIPGHESLFSDIETFISRQPSYLPSITKRDKMVIGIAGQFKKPGSTNHVIIRQADFITNDKISNDSTCQNIIEFFKEISNSL